MNFTVIFFDDIPDIFHAKTVFPGFFFDAVFVWRFLRSIAYKFPPVCGSESEYFFSNFANTVDASIASAPFAISSSDSVMAWSIE